MIIDFNNGIIDFIILIIYFSNDFFNNIFKCHNSTHDSIFI